MIARLLAIVAALAAVAMLAPSARAHHVREGDVRFKVTCSFDQAAEIDPIVHPGTVGVSHRHDFFGRRRMTEDVTTYEELTSLEHTSCNDLDFASYWTPSLQLTDGTWVEPGRMTAYYRRGAKHGTIQPLPVGLKVVAGAGDARMPERTWGWQCDERPRQDAPPEDCGDGALTLAVAFPDCWDGRRLDSADHRSHMRYSVPEGEANLCPTTHPVAVPRMTLYVNYPSVKLGSTVAGLSSGPVDTAHADFFNGWDPARQAHLVETCLNGFTRCDSGLTESPEATTSTTSPPSTTSPGSAP